MKDLIVGTAGHIDHGKTTLVRALTGMDTDRLKEEKRRGITIDIGFAHCALGDYRVGFIDVPGHERFVKNMLAGIGGIHLLLLVVDAEESVMPQTEEHFEICRLLNIPAGLIVITKIDGVDRELLGLVEEELRDLARGSFLEGSPVVAVDSLSGEGIDRLREAMLQQINGLEVRGLLDRDFGRIFRLPIDRVFTIKGFGTVVTGTPVSGEISRDQTLTVYPAGKRVKVRGIEIFNQHADRARAGQRTALNLAGADRSELERGMVLAAHPSLHPSQALDVVLRLLASSPDPIKAGSPVRFHIGSAELIGRVFPLAGSEIGRGEQAPAQIRLDAPTLAFPGDSFIIRRYSPAVTIGGGTVLDAHPSRHRKKELSTLLPTLRRLQLAFESQPGNTARALLRRLVERRDTAGADETYLISRSGWSRKALQETLPHVSGVEVVSLDPLLAVSAASLEETGEKLIEFLQTYHRRHPLSPGISKEELKRRFLNRASPPVFQHFLERLIGEGRLRADAGIVALAGREVRLTSKQESIRSEILRRFERAGLESPSLDELSRQSSFSEAEIREVFFYLVAGGELLRVHEDLYLSPSEIDRMKSRLRAELAEKPEFSVADFKEIFGLTRKYAIPLLEFLDREKVTRRAGEQRRLVDY